MKLTTTKQYELSYDGFNFSAEITYAPDSTDLPTLFLNGAFQGMRSWDPFIAHFSACNHTTIVVDLPGMGNSDVLPVEYSIEFLSDCVKHLLDRLDLNMVNMIAASYSSHIGYQFAQKYPSMVENLVLPGAMKSIPAQVCQDIIYSFQLLGDGNMEAFSDGILGISGPKPGQGLICLDENLPIRRRKVVKRLLKTQLVNMKEREITSYIANTQRLINNGEIDLLQPPSANVSVFTGVYDCFTFPEYGREIAKACSGIFTTIKEADHIFHIEHPNVATELFERCAYNKSLCGISGINQIERY